tara:strand:- start:163 stop:1041 length:879 start_codon:yes stop_codon:yes gene_type:complete
MDPWDISALTPIEHHGNRWYKRDDQFAPLGPTGVNGTKLRQLIRMVEDIATSGAKGLVTAASAHSPQIPMTALVGARFGLPVHIITGGKGMETVSLKQGVQIALEAGATIQPTMPAYNPVLQHAARSALAERPGWAMVPYAISIPEPATEAEAWRFHDASSAQAANLPAAEALIIAFGSGNSSASILWGIDRFNIDIREVHLIGVGPSRIDWLVNRLDQLGAVHMIDRCVHHDLHGAGLVTYGERVNATSDGINLHPNYEAKVARYLASEPHPVPEWDEGDCGWWIVGNEPG